ncbi:MAG: DNA translocase FtsK [Acidobacteria bacterium]|nr:DNA translocase FtsK [Acidobacteriota bacterium]
MATTRKKPSKPRKAVRKPAGRRSRPQPGKAAKPRRKAAGASKATLDQRQRDLLGLALVALAIFIAFPLYSTGDAGIGGDQVVSGLLWALGQAAYLVPVALAGAGLLMILRPVLPVGGNVRIGAVMIVAFLALLLAAGTFGTGPEAPRPGSWQPEYFADRGGALGDGIYVGVASLIGPVGAHLLGTFGLIAGVLVLTGVSIATLLSGASRSVAEITGAARRAAGSLAPDPDRPAPIAPPEPEDEEPVVHAADPWPSDELADEEPPAIEDNPEPETEADPDATVALAEAPAEPEPLPAPAPEPRDGKAVAYRLPNPKLLTRTKARKGSTASADGGATGEALLEALSHFGIEASLVGTVAGPHITRYELKLAPGVKMNKVGNLRDDLAYALAATDIRILAPIPGKQAVGVEVPNQTRHLVTLGDVYGEVPKDASPLTVFLGKDVGGRAVTADLAKMPHLLVAGTTGAGKSATVNAMLSSVLLRATPDQVRLVLVDPKQVELNHYESIPHLLTPVITSPRMAANALQNLVREMEWRYGVMSVAKTRSLVELNRHRVKEGEEPLPYLLCVIDELADLMMVAPGDVEDAIIRLAQKARAVGIHLVLATQSPRVDVITGMIKANVPSRIAFAVSSQTDSRVILDQNGAETLLGQGDMLFSPLGSSRLQRIQGAYIDEGQIEELTGFWAGQGEPALREDLLEEVETEAAPEPAGEDGCDPDEDPALADAIRLVVEMDTASTSMLQRRLRLGYTRAGRLIDMLERRGIISGYEGSKPRQVLIGAADLPRVLAALEADGPAPAGEGDATAVAGAPDTEPE